MKNLKKKGFTIVELVIVIAVIAVLAAVLIPTFSGVIQKANDSSTIQEARNMYSEYVSLFDYTTGTPETTFVIKVDDDKYVAVVNGQLVTETIYASKDAVVAANIGITNSSFVYEGVVNDDNDEEVTPPAGGEETIEVASVTLDKTSLTLNVGEEETLVATVNPDNASDKTITWMSDNQSVATVVNGKVTAIAVGTTIITARAGEKSATCEVTVNEVVVAPTTYTVTKNATNATISGADSVEEGQPYTATITISEHYNTLTIKMGNEDITEEVYNNGNVVIPYVTGDIEITVIAALNLSVPNGDGWLNDSRLGGTDGGQRTQPGWTVTNYFALQNGDIVYVKNLNIYTEPDATYCSAYYDSAHGFIKAFNVQYGQTNGYLKDLVFGEENKRANFTVTNLNVNYMRLCGQIIGDASDVEINILRNGEWVTE